MTDFAFLRETVGSGPVWTPNRTAGSVQATKPAMKTVTASASTTAMKSPLRAKTPANARGQA